MKRIKWWGWVLISIAILVIAFFAYQYLQNRKFAQGKDDKFITASPVDLTQIYGISPFRSCMGHDYSSYNMDGFLEDGRSMKHYVQPLSQFNGTSDKVKLYAPFDGKVARIEGQEKEAMKSADARFGGLGLDIYPLSSKFWTMQFGHVYPLDSIKEGSTFKARELIGYAYVQDTGSSFDLALWTDKKYSRTFSDDNSVNLDSIFNHMTEDILAQFTNKATLDKLILTKEYRDANKCQEIDKGTNAMGDKETGFASSDGDASLQVQINADPGAAKKDAKCVSDSDCGGNMKCLFKDGDPGKGVCTIK